MGFEGSWVGLGEVLFRRGLFGRFALGVCHYYAVPKQVTTDFPILARGCFFVKVGF